MRVESIELYDFTELGRANRIRIDCNEKVNLLVGPNASGKSTILRELFNQLAPQPEAGEEGVSEEDEDVGEEERLFSLFCSSEWPLDADGKPVRAAVPLLNIPAFRTPFTDYNSLGTDEGALDFDEDDPGIRIVIGNEVFEGSDFLNSTRIPPANRKQFEDTIQKCFNDIGPEVLNHIDIEITYERSGTTVQRFLVTKTEPNSTREADDTAEVSLRFTSSGTHSTLQWISVLALMLARSYHWETGWEAKPAILLIDEIENHLHPTWQRRVIPSLLEHFPGLQIFATTHSPYVVAGLKAGQVHKLRRDPQGKVEVDTENRNIIGWTSDRISREMLEIIDPVDWETAKNSDLLRSLREEGSRSDPESEQERQKSIRDLEGKVNRETLAGGALPAQRELFKRYMAEVLEKYGQSQNLN